MFARPASVSRLTFSPCSLTDAVAASIAASRPICVPDACNWAFALSRNAWVAFCTSAVCA